MMNWSGRLRAGNSDGLRDRRNRWRRTVGFLLGALLWGGISLGAFSGPAEAAGEISVLVFGEKLDFDVPPVMDNGRLLVPTRYIGEALRAEVTYDAASRTVLTEKGRYSVSLPLDSDSALKSIAPEAAGGVTETEYISLDVPAKLVGGRVLVPARFLAEALDLEVYWNDKTSTVYVGMYLEDSSQGAGWQILKGHSLENKIEILVKEGTEGGQTQGADIRYNDLVRDPDERIRWHNGQIWQTQTRKEIYTLLDNQSYFWGPKLCQAYFGQVYQDWLEWEYDLADAEEMYERYLACRDLSRYGLSGNYDDEETISISGALESRDREEFAYLGQSQALAKSLFGQPLNTRFGAVGEKTEHWDYADFSLSFTDGDLTGFSASGGGWGTAGSYIGDSGDSVYPALGLEREGAGLETVYSGNNALELYVQENSVTRRYDRITKKAAENNNSAYLLRYILDREGRISALSLEKVN